MRKYQIAIDCINCGETIKKTVGDFTDDDLITVNVFEFSQTDWECPECDHITCIGDIDMMDREDI